MILVCLPFLLKWFKERSGLAAAEVGSHAKLVSALAVGPHQRVVTVEVGPEGSKQRLILGVTAQAITCLHTMPVEPAPPTL